MKIQTINQEIKQTQSEINELLREVNGGAILNFDQLDKKTRYLTGLAEALREAVYVASCVHREDEMRKAATARVLSQNVVRS